MTRVLMALFTLASVSLFLALAVWGEGGLTAFARVPALIALAAISYVCAAAALFTTGSLSSGEREDRGNRWVLAAFGLIGLAVASLPAWSDRTGFAVFGGTTVRWIGVALYAGGCALRMVPVFVLGRRFSGLVAIQPDHALVTDGLYRRVRHPSYLGMVILMVGWALVFRSWIGLGLAALTVPILIARMNAEEALLGSQFGDAYAIYKARSWRLIPWVY
jgi:protein-S-isoprenylcysteine O-methyltransferase Ste14